MKIIIDSREQAPLEFKHEYITEIVHKKLNYGDYSCEFIDGTIPPIYFERKSIPDLFGTLGKGYERFKKEIIRSQSDNSNLILIIEGTLFDIYNGTPHSTIDGSKIVKQLFTLWIRHGIQPVFCSTRQIMADYITQVYLACGREHIRKGQK